MKTEEIYNGINEVVQNAYAMGLLADGEDPDGAVVILPVKDGAMVLEVGDIPDIVNCWGFDAERRRDFMRAVWWIAAANGIPGPFPRNEGVAKYHIGVEPGWRTIESMRKRDREDMGVLMEYYASKYYPRKTPSLDDLGGEGDV